MRRFLTIFLPLAVMLLGCVPDEITVTSDPVSGSGEQTATLTDPGLSWSSEAVTAYLGKSDNSYPTLSFPSGVSITYSSSDGSVATIDSGGEVTLVSEGTATISATSAQTDTYEEGSAYYSLTVCKSESGLEWSDSEVSIVIGSEYTLPTLSNPNGLEVSYSSSDSRIASIDSDSGEVTVIADGSVVITAESAQTDIYEAGTASYTLNITKNTDGISWSTSSCTVTIGASDNAFPTLNNPGGQEVTYSSSNPSVAEVNSSTGEITLVAAGTTTITASSAATDVYESATVSYTLTVHSEGSNLASADLSWPSASYTATMGEDFSSPSLSNPHGLDVNYASTDESVATISSAGTVTVLSAGVTTITATSEATSEYAAGSAYYTLTVSLADPLLSWSASSYTATFGESNTYPTLTNTYGLEVTYSTGSPSVATIDSNGEITLVGSGTTSVKATYEGDGTFAAATVYYTLKVNKGTATLSWSPSSFSASLEESNTFPTLSITPSGLSVTYSSSDASVATVGSSSGEIALLSAGITTITASFAGNDYYKAASASYTLSVRSSADDGAVTTTFDSAGDPSSEDDISNTSFTRLVTVTYSTSGATITGYTASGVAEYFTVVTSGNKVTITYTGSENVAYKLTGTASDGFFKLYSSKKQAIWLSGVSITSSSGAAINNQSGKRTFIYVDGTNRLADGSSAAYSTENSEDMKAVLFSEGQLIFSSPSSGNNTLTVTADNASAKSAIVSDDYVRFLASPTVTVSSGSSAGHGVRGKEYVRISDGTLSVTTKAAMKKGIGSDDYVLVEGGTTTVTVSGGVAKDESGEYTGTAGVRADNYFAMTGGSLTIKNTGSGGKGISAGSYDYDASDHALSDSYISGGTLNITTTGSESNDVSSKGIKIGYKHTEGKTSAYAGNFNISGGSIIVKTSKSEGIEAKGDLTVSGGEVYSYSNGDDAINAQGEVNVTGGYIYAYSSANDAMDSNCDMNLSGGYVFAVTTAGNPEVALDANTEERYKLYINSGATVVAYGGLESGYSASQTVYSFSCTAGKWNALHNGSSYIAAFNAPSGVSSVAVSAPSLSKGYTNVTVGSSDYLCNSMWAVSGISGGTATSLSTYNGGSGPGGGGGGHGPGW